MREEVKSYLGICEDLSKSKENKMTKLEKLKSLLEKLNDRWAKEFPNITASARTPSKYTIRFENGKILTGSAAKITDCNTEQLEEYITGLPVLYKVLHEMRNSKIDNMIREVEKFL